MATCRKFDLLPQRESLVFLLADIRQSKARILLILSIYFQPLTAFSVVVNSEVFLIDEGVIAFDLCLGFI